MSLAVVEQRVDISEEFDYNPYAVFDNDQESFGCWEPERFCKACGRGLFITEREYFYTFETGGGKRGRKVIKHSILVCKDCKDRKNEFLIE
ncbi:MAG: hypothetical protein R6V54_02505 [Desulfobacteraceae bacterium]